MLPPVGKKVHETVRNESDVSPNQSDYEFFIETNNIQNSVHINQIKNEISDWSITQIGFLFHRKLISELNVTIFF